MKSVNLAFFFPPEAKLLSVAECGSNKKNLCARTRSRSLYYSSCFRVANCYAFYLIKIDLSKSVTYVVDITHTHTHTHTHTYTHTTHTHTHVYIYI